MSTVYCERCHMPVDEENIINVGGHEGWGQLCEDCADTLTYEDEDEDG